MPVRMEKMNGEFQESYVGAVIATRERNYHDDSDFYAVVWDEAEQRVKYVEYATTRFATYNNDAQVDATPEVEAKARAWQADRLFEIMKSEGVRLFEIMKSEGVRLARTVKVGRRVRIVRGRKLAHGTEGVVGWYGETRYGYRVGLDLPSGERVWTDARNVEVVNPEQYVPSDGDLRARANNAVLRGVSWGTFFSPGMVVL